MNDGCVNNRPAVHDESELVQVLFHVIEHLTGDVVLFLQVLKMQKFRGIGGLFCGKVNPQKGFTPCCPLMVCVFHVCKDLLYHYLSHRLVLSSIVICKKETCNKRIYQCFLKYAERYS